MSECTCGTCIPCSRRAAAIVSRLAVESIAEDRRIADEAAVAKLAADKKASDEALMGQTYTDSRGRTIVRK